jgi:hypothetical protein
VTRDWPIDVEQEDFGRWNVGDRLLNMLVYSRGCKVGDRLQGSVVNVHEHCLAKEPSLVLLQKLSPLSFPSHFLLKANSVLSRFWYW